MFDKFKKFVKAAGDDIVEAADETIEYEKEHGTLRDSKDQPLAANKEPKDKK